MSDTTSERRLILNEATQRLENDKARRTLLNILESDDLINFICECSAEDCKEHIALTNRMFIELHKSSKEFVVKPDHETVAIETVVKKTDDYFIVRKHIDPELLGSAYFKNG